jgi:hypothetical protein
MLLSYPLFVVEELLSITLTVIVTYAIVLRFELPVYYIIPIIAALNALSVAVQKQVHGPATDDTILLFAAGILLFTAGIIHLIILKMRFNWLETVGITLASGILSFVINYLLL